jgi:tol-pal system protein YbgF
MVEESPRRVPDRGGRGIDPRTGSVKQARFWLAPLAATLTAGCFATRNDVRLLKADIERMHAEAETGRKADADRMRAELARRDSVAASATRRVELAVDNLLDTLRTLNEDLNRLRATQATSTSELQLQIETIQQIVGVTQQQLRAQAARQEAQREAMNTAAAPGDTGGTEGPLTFYHVGIDQMQKNAWGLARNAFQELLTKFPTDSLVADALYQIGVSYSAEKMDAKADSVWSIVVRDYSKSDRAPGALYKRAFQKADSGSISEARALYQRLIREYPGTDEAKNAAVRLRELTNR